MTSYSKKTILATTLTALKTKLSSIVDNSRKISILAAAINLNVSRPHYGLARHHNMINCLQGLGGKKSYINIRILTELNQTWSNCLFYHLNGNGVHGIRFMTDKKKDMWMEKRRKCDTYRLIDYGEDGL